MITDANNKTKPILGLSMMLLRLQLKLSCKLLEPLTKILLDFVNWKRGVLELF
jgi:hypothetical protein